MEHFFGLGRGWLPARAAKIAREYGATLVNHTDPQCNCGHGCDAYTCSFSRRHWFATENLGEPHNSRVAREVLDALAVAGIEATK